MTVSVPVVRLGLAVWGLTSTGAALFAQGPARRPPCEVKSEYEKATQAPAPPLLQTPLKPSAGLLALEAKVNQAHAALSTAKKVKDTDEAALLAAERDLDAFRKNPAQGKELEAIDRLRDKVTKEQEAFDKIDPRALAELMDWRIAKVDPKLDELQRLLPGVSGTVCARM